MPHVNARLSPWVTFSLGSSGSVCEWTIVLVFFLSSPFQIGKRNPGAKPSAPAQHDERSSSALRCSWCKQLSAHGEKVPRKWRKRATMCGSCEAWCRGLQEKSLSISLLPQVPSCARDRHQPCPFLGQRGRGTAPAPEKGLDHRALGDLWLQVYLRLLELEPLGNCFSRWWSSGGELLQEALPKTTLVPCGPLLLFNCTSTSLVALQQTRRLLASVVNLMCSVPKSWQQPGCPHSTLLSPTTSNNPQYVFASTYVKLLVKDNGAERGGGSREEERLGFGRNIFSMLNLIIFPPSQYPAPR